MARRITIEFLGQDKGLGRSVADAESKTSRLGDTLKKVGKFAAVGLAAGAAVAGKAMFDMTKMAIEDQKSQALLAQTLKNTTGATKGQVAEVEDWISAQGKALGVADDELRPALQRLAEATGSVSEAQKLSSLAMDISAGTGKSLKTVSEALAKAQMGQVGALSRYGIRTRDAAGELMSFEDVAKSASKTFEGQAAKSANTLEGKMGRLKLIFDETREEIGSKLIPVVTKLADWFLREGLPAISRFGDWFRTNLIPIFVKVRAVINKVLGGMRGDVGGNLKAIRSIVADATKIVRALWDRFGKHIIANLKAVFNVLKAVVKGGLQIIAGIFKVISSVLRGDWRKAWDGIKDIVRGAWTIIRAVVKNGWDVIKTLFRAAGGVLRDVMRGAWNGVKDIARAGVGAVVDVIRGVPGRIRDLAGNFAAAGRALIGALVNGLKNAGGVISGIAGNVWSAVKSMLNSAIGRINSALEFTIRLPGPDLTINPPNIPYLAKGGIVNRPTLAVIGEAGPEAVVPLSGANARKAGVGTAQPVQENITVVLQLDGREIHRSLVKRKRALGTTLGLA